MADSATDGVNAITSDEQLRSAIDFHRESIMNEFGLSKREREVVDAILDGDTRASAAKRLFISERTVKFHLENCYRKMGVSGKTELIQRFKLKP